ncbi:hypothetical protein OC846_005350 [Tilletia horrida]|uniref:TRP C-terminal domain-containing protein n=1 Tax=Tilletia horrida TaxID=155126 RepID=A0AAN6GNH3_9BASI|nr:hypothetical protein OC846_005350 [Tilletia horrida]KAK0552754.1 hypothetical protein OC845_001540 [Tilletia horrida]KAK0561983.1 hypothetical protein OC861_005547 [Tilletia horrida]
MRSQRRSSRQRSWANASTTVRFWALSLLILILASLAIAQSNNSGPGNNNDDDDIKADTGDDSSGSGSGSGSGESSSSLPPATSTTTIVTTATPSPSSSSTPAPTTTSIDDTPSNGLPPGTTRSTTTVISTGLPTGSLTSGTPTSTTSSAAPAPTYTNVTLALSPSYQSNFFLHQPLPDPFYGSAAHTRAPDMYFKDCNFQASDNSLVASDFRINVTSVYSQFDEDLNDNFMGRRAPTKGILRIVAVGEIGAQAHAADNVTNYLSAISVQTNFLTFPVFSNLTYLCDRIFPTTADLLNPLITPTSCAYGPGPVAIGVSIPINSPYYLGTLNTQLRLSDPSKPARNIACISVNVSPYHPSAWYWHLILWLPIATFITLFVLAALARLLTALSVLRTRFANRAREGTGPSWVRDKLRPTLAAALSGEHLRSSAGLVRFASPGCWDVIWHLQFVTAIGMMAVHWPDWAYPFLKQAAWASLLGNVTVLNSEMSVDPTQYAQGVLPSGHIDVLRTYAALPGGDIGDQMRNNVTSPIYMNTDASLAAASHQGQNRFLNLNNTAYGIPRYGYMLGLHEQDLWPTAVVIWFYILAGIVALSFVLWLADATHSYFESARNRRQADDYDTAGRNSTQSEAQPINGAAGASGPGGSRANEGSIAGSLAPPRSPAASTSASLNFATATGRGGTSAAQSPGGIGKNGDDGYVEQLHLANSASALTIPSNGHFGSYDDDGGESGQSAGNKEARLGSPGPGHAHLPASSTTRWGQYRFLGSLGSTSAGLNTASGQEKHNRRRMTRSGDGAPAKLHLSHLHGNVIRVVALFHFPLTILSIWGLQSHDGAHSTVQRALAALFFVVVCLLIPLYACVRIWFASREQLYEDMPTFTQLGPLYNSYAPGAHRYVIALFAWTLIMGIVIGAAQSSGSAQALVLLIFETGMSIATNLWLPWGEGANMGPAAFVGSVLRIITAVLLVLLSPLAGFGGAVAGWITYVVLVLQAIWFVGVFLIVVIKLLELAVRVAFNIPYEEGTRRAYNGLEGAIKQIRRRQDKILQLGSRSPGAGGLRRPGSRASGTGSSIMHNMTSSPGGGGAGMQSGGVNRPIPLTHSRQVSYASYLDNPRMNAQPQHRLSQQAGYGSYAGYFHHDPHDEGGIMAAMPPSSPGLGRAPSPFSWKNQTPGASASAGGPKQRSPAQTRPSSSGNGGNPNPGSSPPSTGFVRLGGGRATDTQPWQSIPDTGASAQAANRPAGPSPQNTIQTSGAVEVDPATAAAVAAARRRSRPQSQTAIVESYNWMDQGGNKAVSPQTSPRGELLPLPDHRSSFNALVIAQRRAQAAAADAEAGASADPAAGGSTRKSDKRTSVGGGLFSRKKRQGLRRLSEGHVAEDSFDDEEEDEEEEQGQGGTAGGNTDKSGKASGVFSGLSRFVGGLRSNPRRQSDVDADDAQQAGFEMEEEFTPKQTGFEVIRKPRRPVAPPPQEEMVAASVTGANAPAEAKETKAEAAVNDAATATPGSPLGDGSLPPQTDLGKLNAGLGLNFNATPAIGGTSATDNSASPSRNRLAAATPTTAEVKRWSETPSEAEIRHEIEKAAANASADANTAPTSEQRPAGVTDDSAFWRS